ncbi:MAG: hypothetical protein ABEI52_05490 [Halobacteriaceae archaeon]
MDRRRFLAGITCANGFLLSGCVQGGQVAPNTTSTDETTTTTENISMLEHAFSAEQIGSGNEVQTATISLGSTTTVTGKTTGGTSCHTAKLKSATLNDDRLKVIVKARKREDADTICTQGLVVIRYTATFEFTDDGPNEVVVYHDSLGETQRIARTSK